MIQLPKKCRLSLNTSMFTIAPVFRENLCANYVIARSFTTFRVRGAGAKSLDGHRIGFE
jgi:hypothetical protein